LITNFKVDYKLMAHASEEFILPESIQKVTLEKFGATRSKTRCISGFVIR